MSRNDPDKRRKTTKKQFECLKKKVYSTHRVTKEPNKGYGFVTNEEKQ